MDDALAHTGYDSVMDASRTWLCYQATNLVNGKRYIGITGRSLAARRAGHKATAKRGEGKIFAAAIRVYGIDGFSFCILKEGMSKLEAAAMEIQLIALLKPEYNASAGGDGAVAPPPEQLERFYKGRVGACERRKKPVICLTDGRQWLSVGEAAAAVGARQPEVSASCRGLHRYVKGLRFAFDVPGLDVAAEMARRDALQKYRKGFPKPPFRKTDKKQQRDRAIVDLATGRRFASVSVAAKSLGKTTGQISHACKAKTIGRSGSMLRYADEIELRTGNWVQGRHRQVLCVGVNKIFPSAAEAGRYFGVTGSLIGAVCNRRKHCKTAAGYVFRWA